MTQLGFHQVYLLDTNCVTRLDGKDRRNYQPPTFSNTERAHIWAGLESLTQEGRLKIIQPVKDELQRLHPQGLLRLSQYPGHRLTLRKRVSSNLALYHHFVSAYPDIAPKPGGAEGDSWLLVAGKRFGYPIITMELSLARRSPKANRKLRIPDVCALEAGLQCMDLRELANHEGWLS